MFHHTVNPFIGGFNLLFLLAFTLSVVAQLNDPDAAAWIVFYALAAAACLAFHFGRLHWYAGAALSGVVTVLCLWLLPQFIGKVQPAEVVDSLAMQTSAVEEAREAGGALLVALWSAFLTWYGKTRQDHA